MKKRCAAGLLAAATILSLWGCGSRRITVSLTYGEEDSEVLAAAEAEAAGREGTAYSDFAYEQYDPAHLQELIEEVLAKAGDAANADAVTALLGEVEDEYAKMNLSYSLADLYSYQDVTSDEYTDAISYITDVVAEMDDAVDGMYRSLLSSPCRNCAFSYIEEADAEYYESYTDLTEDQQELFHQEQELLNQYYELAVADYTTEVSGQECDAYDLYSLYVDGKLKKEAYKEARRQIRSQENEALGPIYVELVKVRNQLARSFGYDTYTEYVYVEDYARDYTPEDALSLAEYARTWLNDPMDTLYERYDSEECYALDDYFAEVSIDDQLSLLRSWLGTIDDSLLNAYSFMIRNQLYDLEYSEVKANQGFTTWIYGYDEPFLYNEPEGDFYDFETLVHEFGHYHAMYEDECAEDLLDLAEVHSQGLEVLFTGIYPQMLGESMGKAASEYTLVQVFGSVLDGCMYDEFQQKVYALEDPTLDEINHIFHDVAVEYGYDYGDYDTAFEWVEVSHNFDSPLYYVSYAVSALPALELWELSRTDFDGACGQYMRLVAAGSNDTYLATLEDMGLTDPFAEDTIKSLGETLTAYLAE